MTKLTATDRKTALITGASSGIGEELAKCFAQAGFNLLLVARSKAKLDVLARRLANQHRVKAWAVAADLSRPDGAEQLFKTLAKDRRQVDVLVNCAGVLAHGQFVLMPATRHQDMIDLNISALTAMLALFTPPMVARGYGRVLNVASIAAFQPVVSLATYAATKAYVLSLTESFAEELKGSGVTVTALCPGITATQMMVAAQQDSPGLKPPGFLISDAAQVAADGFKACMRGDVIKVSGAVNLATTLASRATPKWLIRQISGALGRITVKN